MSALHMYCGWVLDSELAFPELPAAEPVPDIRADVHIRFAACPDRLTDAVDRAATFEFSRSEALWRLDGVGRYRIAEGGCRIDIDPAPGCDAGSLRLFLLQPVLALAAMMRGELMLAAAAVEGEGSVIAFVGPPASGKSMAAALLLRNGHRLVSDSLLRITCDATGRVLAYPQAPWLWLWPDAIGALGGDPATHPPLRPGIDLRRVTFPVASGPLPLVRVAVLHEQRGDDLDLFEPDNCHGAVALELLLRHVAGRTWIEAFADRRELLLSTAQIARSASVERLDIPWGLRHVGLFSEALQGWGEAAVAAA